MKNTIITAKQKKRELLFILISFIIAFALNIYSIIYYDSQWKELITTLHITLLMTIAIYFLLAIIRLIFKGFAYLFNKNR
ncbi:MAG: hypothetical protein IMY71_10705 [Bacteroidetes bacterium]|nr:hypothetical protein [Bacteroidota bacterium]